MPDSDFNKNNCSFHKFEKNKYFYGKLMTVSDFEAEQQYFDGKRHLINRLLHGPGIICGFKEMELTKTKEGEKESYKIRFIDGGIALTCCGHEIAVLPGTDKQIKAGNTELVSDLSRFSYFYLKYRPYDCGYVAVASNSSGCEEKCCPSRVVDDFEVIAFASKEPLKPEIDCNNGKDSISNWLRNLEDKFKICPKCEENQRDLVFLGRFDYNDNLVKQTELAKDRIMFRPKELYQLFKCQAQDFDSYIDNFKDHVTNFKNPHRVTAKQIEAIIGINSVRNPGGSIELVNKNAITIDPDDANNSIIIGETHSAITEGNPHNVTALETGALTTLNRVKNLNGNIDLIQKGSIAIESDDANNSIIIGETHSAIKEGNPHDVTARETGALVSVDGVSNPGGNINLIQSGSIEISPDNSIHTITIGETHSAKEDNPHRVTAFQTGALVSLDGISNPGGNIDLIEGMNIKIKPDENNNSITFDCILRSEIQPSDNMIKSIGPENLVGTSTMYARADHVHMLEDNSVDYNKLSAGLQEQLGILSAYVRERALKCSASSFKKIAEDFKNDSAFDISLSFKKAIGKRLYEKEDDFIKFIDSMQSPIKVFADEIREPAEEGGLIDFENSLEALQKTIGEGNPLKVAAQQDEVCFYALELRLTVNDPLYKALNCTGLSFRKVAELFKSETASKISFNFEKAIDSGVYEDRDKFVKFMQENLELLRTLSEELKIKATEGSLSNYSFSVEQLADSIDSDEALEIADRQQEVCSYAQNLAVSNNPINNPMYRALKCAVGIYREVSRKLQSDIADTLSIDFERAVNSRLYDSEKEFIEFMESEIDLLKALPEEIEGLAIEEELTNYIAVVNELADAIQSGNALEVAAKQEELCFYAEKLDPSTLMYRALKCTTVNFAEAADLFENKTAKAISEKFGIALNKKIHEDDDKFIKFMDENLELFETFAKEIKDLATKETLKKYISSVEKLAASIRSGDALKIAVQQEEVCSAAWGLDIHLVP